jgi:hypothetical protein
MLLLTQYYVAREGIWNREMSFNVFLGKDDVEGRSNIENVRDVHLWRHELHY